MSIKAVRGIFVIVAVVLLYMFFRTLPARPSSKQIDFDTWLEQSLVQPGKLDTITVRLSLPPSSTEPSSPLEFEIKGHRDREAQEHIRRILQLIQTGGLLSLEDDSAKRPVDSALVSITALDNQFDLVLNQSTAQKIPAAGVLLRLLVEYRDSRSTKSDSIGATNTPLAANITPTAMVSTPMATPTILKDDGSAVDTE